MYKALILLTVLVLAGCASVPAPVEFPVSPNMATSYAGGETIISWKADTDQTYTIYFTGAPPGKSRDWKPLPQANGLRGAGKQITVTDQVDENSPRRYLLLTGNQKPF